MKRLVHPVAALLGCAALTYLLYGYSLSLSFMLDDFNDLPRAATSSITTILTASQGYVYYRPLALLVEKVPYAIQGFYDPFWYHLMPLSLHALNGWLVYLLARRLSGAWAAPWAAAFFITYPLSYEVGARVDALMHPLVALFALASLLAYYEGRRRSSFGWIAVAMAVAALAPPTHENGVLVGPMILLLELFLWRKGLVPRLWLPSATFLAPSAAFLIIWWIIPKQPQPWAFDPNSIKLNTLFFLQGLSYPVAGSLGGLSRWTGLPAEVLAWVAVPVCVVGLALIYYLGKARSFFLFALSWFVVAVLPAWALLSYAYVIDGPRLLYLASAPVSLIWAGLWQLPSGRGRGAFLWRLGLAALAVAVLWPSWDFLSVRRDMLSEASRTVFRMADVVSQGPGGRVLLVNEPSWFAVKGQEEYPMGHMGVSFLPDYLGLERAVFMHRGVNPDLKSLSYQDLLKPWRYNYGPHGGTVSLEEMAAAVRDSDVVYLAAYEPEGIAPTLERRYGLNPAAGAYR